MAKPKYDEWLIKEKLVLLEGWARDGLIDNQIAKNMGIGVRTLYEWKNNHPQIAQAIKKGKEVVDYEVENALLKNALEGNTVAQIFWLKNRKPDKWKDKRDNVIEPDQYEDDGFEKALSSTADEVFKDTAGDIDD